MKSFLQENIEIRPLLWGIAVMLLALQPLQADEPVNVTDMKDCSEFKADAERLLCYDTVAKGGVFNQQQLEKVQVENFGSKERETEISVDKIGTTIVRVEKDVNSLRYFVTSEGQVWKQSNRGSFNSKPPFEVVIEEGMMGSFFMTNDDGRSIRVKRVK